MARPYESQLEYVKKRALQENKVESVEKFWVHYHQCRMNPKYDTQGLDKDMLQFEAERELFKTYWPSEFFTGSSPEDMYVPQIRSMCIKALGEGISNENFYDLWAQAKRTAVDLRPLVCPGYKKYIMEEVLWKQIWGNVPFPGIDPSLPVPPPPPSIPKQVQVQTRPREAPNVPIEPIAMRTRSTMRTRSMRRAVQNGTDEAGASNGKNQPNTNPVQATVQMESSQKTKWSPRHPSGRPKRGMENYWAPPTVKQETQQLFMAESREHQKQADSHAPEKTKEPEAAVPDHQQQQQPQYQQQEAESSSSKQTQQPKTPPPSQQVEPEPQVPSPTTTFQPCLTSQALRKPHDATKGTFLEAMFRDYTNIRAFEKGLGCKVQIECLGSEENLLRVRVMPVEGSKEKDVKKADKASLLMGYWASKSAEEVWDEIADLMF